MRVLIVGGTGVISTPLTARLVEAGHEVVHYNRGQRPIRGAAPAATITGDRNDFPRFEAQMAEAGHWDCVYDMVVFRPEEAASAVHAFRGRTRLYAFCSTVDVYQKPAPCYPVTEDSPLQGVSAYGIAKAACEAALVDAHDRGDLAVTTLRPAYTYGPGARGVLHSLGFDTRFLERLRRGLPVIVHGDGMGLWVACDAADAATAFAGVLGNEGASGRAYNVVGEETITWNQYVQRLAAALGWPAPELVRIPTDLLLKLAPEAATITAENLQFPNVIGNARAKAELGFRCTVPFETGMLRLVEWLDIEGKLDRGTDEGYERILDTWRAAEAAMLATVKGV